MKLRELSIRQELSAAFLFVLLARWLVPLAFGNPSSPDSDFWFFIVLFASLLLPARLTAHLLAFWGLFFAALSLALAIGVPVVGFPPWARGSYAIGFGVAGLALLGSAVVARRRAVAKG